MKHLKIAGLCLVSMFVMGMALAGNASATTLLWLLCLEASGLTKYEDNQCTKANGTGKWQSQGLPSGGKDTVRLLGFSLVLSDTGIGTTVTCGDVGEASGTIEGSKLITNIARSNAPEAEGCTESGEFLTCKPGKLTKLEGAHLPWTSENFETEGKHLANITGTGGTPGWKITCGGATDECTESTTAPREGVELLSGVTKGVLLVLSVFESKNKGNCTVGGTLKGVVKGLVGILLINGNGLSLTSI
jgi:hypothetical protein